MEELHMTWLTWLPSSVLAEFQELNTDPLSLLYKMGTLSMEKLSFFVAALNEPTSEKMNFGDFLEWKRKEVGHYCLYKSYVVFLKGR